MSNHQSLNILVIDRDESTIAQLKSILTQDGYQVDATTETARTGDLVRTNSYQLVILDVSPGHQGGIDALQTIRSIDNDLCVVATTELASVEMAVTTMKHQAFHYLQKPLDEEELRAVLQEAVRTKGLLIDLETRLNLEVGKRIRERRHAEPLTLKQLANRTGLSVSLISQIELGKSAASMSTLHKLATALGVKMTYFFETV